MSWFSSVSNSINQNLGTNIDLEALAKQAQDNAQKLKDDALKATEELGSYTGVGELIDQVANDIQAEESKFFELSVEKETLLPWETDDEAKSILSQGLMEKIFELSLHKENFTTPVPDDDSYTFNLDSFVDIIIKLLKLDPNLSKMQGTVGVQMDEKEFWKNYFYRCACLRYSEGFSSYGLNVEDKSSIDDIILHIDKLRVQDTVILDANEGGEIVFEKNTDLESEQIASSSDKKKEDELEADLDAELEAELGELGDDDLDGDYDDLGDLDMDDLGDLDNDGVDAELEAQIARELDEEGF